MGMMLSPCQRFSGRDVAGRNCNTEVNGVRTELKKLKAGRAETLANRIGKSTRRGGQARNLVIDSRGTGMTRDEADRGIAKERPVARGRLDYVHVVGDSFDATYSRFG